MRFKRISTDTVRCIVSQEELREHGLELEDFISNNGKTEEFLREMIELAEEEVGFKVQGGPLTIQVATLPENTLALTFCEKQTGNIMDILEGLKSAMSSLSDVVNEKAAQKAKDTGGDASRAVPSIVPSIEQREAYLLVFDDMKTLQAFCASVDEQIEERMQMNSELYQLRDEGSYALVLHRGEMDEKQICQIMSASIEFMQRISADNSQIAYIREHGNCMIANHAITRMQQLLEGHYGK